MFESDGWLDWEPDPERASRDAQRVHEPYASMSKQQILEKMASATGGREWELYQEFFLDRCTPDELATHLEEFLKTQYVLFGFEELCLVEEAVELALRRRNGLKQAALTAENDNAGSGYPLLLPERIPPNVPVLEKSS